MAGVSFAVGPAACLSNEERSLLAGLNQASAGDERYSDPFRLSLSNDVPWEGADVGAFADNAPATIVVTGERVRIAHRRYLAEIRPDEHVGCLYRRDFDGGALGITLRVALSTRLPLEGGLPLHAAGVLAGAVGLAFFGPSGAGKSTLAATSPWPVLSDELVVAAGSPFRLLGAGFWGTLGPREATAGARLSALVELAKGPRFHLSRLSRRTALRRLLGVILVPPHPSVWREALIVLGRLVDAVPVYRMTWSPAQLPWAALEEVLTAGPAEAHIRTVEAVDAI